MELCVILHPVFQQDWKQKKRTKKKSLQKNYQTKNN